MPSHDDRVRRHDSDTSLQEGLTPPRETLERPFSELERYAGWLGKDHVSVAVRADVHALGAAIAVGTETSPLLVILDKDIGRLPGGDLRKMLRKALGQLRAVLEPSGIESRNGDRP